MLFCSQNFFVFFIVVFTIYWSLPWNRLRVWLLLGASIFFYASWNEWLALIICVSTAIDFCLARGMESASSPRWRKLLLTVSLVGNLGLLCYFKYANFFLHSVEEALNAAGATASLPVLRVILPVGISFYTFEAISYTVDVYRKRIKAERNLAHFMLFITFFPHLVAGPIVRGRDFLPQIGRPKRWDWARLHLGAGYFLMGLFKKLVIADRMALFADPVFADPTLFNSGAVWIAILAYTLQIYCDFSGYSDMAIGCAHMLGYKLPMNFNMPFIATNISDLWRRWHISLSTWLRDYVLMPLCFRGPKRSPRAPKTSWLWKLASVPLGGERGSKWRFHYSLFVTMTVCGLWHGASWNFVIFGMLHGLMLMGHRIFQEFCEGRSWVHNVLSSRPGTVLRVVMTLLAFSLTGIAFRTDSLDTALAMLRGLVVSPGVRIPPQHVGSFFSIVGVVVLCHLLGRDNHWRKLSGRLPAPALGFGYAAVLGLVLVLAPELGQAFIYFQF